MKEQVVHSLKLEPSTRSNSRQGQPPRGLAALPGGCKKAIAGRDHGDGPHQSPHFTREDTEALGKERTDGKVGTGSQVTGPSFGSTNHSCRKQ